MRRFIRHPTDVPIEYRLKEPGTVKHQRLRDVSEGGLCFESETGLEPGTRIHIVIPVRNPHFEADATVVWCHFRDGRYELGVEFDQQASKFAIRMVEQVCHIEQYRKDILEVEGRYLSGDQAALEWIARYAQDFPMYH